MISVIQSSELPESTCLQALRFENFELGDIPSYLRAAKSCSNMPDLCAGFNLLFSGVITPGLALVSA